MITPPTPMRATPTKQAIRCRGCGYDLRAHGSSNRCPECGRSTYDARWDATPIRMSIESESGLGLIQASFLLAALPLSGMLILNKVGGVIAVVAIFGPLFHLFGQWRFNRSPLRELPESSPIGPLPVTAIPELAVATFACVVVAFLQGTTFSSTAWPVIAAAWPPLAALRCAAWCFTASRIMEQFGLRLARLVELVAGVALAVAGLGLLATTLVVILVSSNSQFTAAQLIDDTDLMLALVGGCGLSLLAIAACLLSAEAGRRVDAILNWEMIDRRRLEKDSLSKPLARDTGHQAVEDLPPI
ncbi:MAG: hypothetical protein MK085_14125, partial [Phycisphaerales bacterium]|nr:hypothetical protein [Phycisphaerales bacterium]